MRKVVYAIFLLAMLVFSFARVLADEPAAKFDPDPVVSLFELLVDGADPDTARQCLGILAEKILTREVSAEQLVALRPRLEPTLENILTAKPQHALFTEAALLAANWRHAQATAAVRQLAGSAKSEVPLRLRAIEVLLAADDAAILETAGQLLHDENSPAEFRASVLAALGRSEAPQIAAVVLAAYPKLNTALQPKAVELLTQRTAWSKALLDAIGNNQLPAHALNVNQVAKLLASRDEELVKAVKARWGTLRTERNPQREQLIAEFRTQFRAAGGDAHRGHEVFKRVCAQCHKIYGEGHEVGPDVTLNGRNNFDQLLSNVLDPSLVIGVAYQAATVVTTDGRTLTGLVAEDSPQRVVLKVQGGKQEVVPREEVEVFKLSELSLMPEGLEKQLKPEELIDLFAFLVLDKPPSDPTAKRLAGAGGN